MQQRLTCTLLNALEKQDRTQHPGIQVYGFFQVPQKKVEGLGLQFNILISEIS